MPRAEPKPDRGRHLGLVLSILGLIVMAIAVYLLFQGDDDPQAARTTGTEETSLRRSADEFVGDGAGLDPAGDATADADEALVAPSTTTTAAPAPIVTVVSSEPVSLGAWRLRVVGASSMVDVVHVQLAISWAGSGTGDPNDLTLLLGQAGATYPAGGTGCPVGSDELDQAQIGSAPVEAALCFIVPDADLTGAQLLAASTSNPSKSATLDLQ